MTWPRLPTANLLRQGAILAEGAADVVAALQGMAKIAHRRATLGHRVLCSLLAAACAALVPLASQSARADSGGTQATSSFALREQDGGKAIEITNVTFETTSTYVPGRPADERLLLRTTTHSRQVIDEEGLEASVTVEAWPLGSDPAAKPLYAVTLDGVGVTAEDSAVLVFDRGTEDVDWWSVYGLGTGASLFDSHVPMIRGGTGSIQSSGPARSGPPVTPVTAKRSENEGQGSAVLLDIVKAGGKLERGHGRIPDSHQYFEARPGDIARGLPVVVLVNGDSASAAEIVAAAMQDSGRGVIVGSNSYGKGTVQTVLHMPNDGELTLTWARFHAPSGYTLNHLGVLPSVCTTTEDSKRLIDDIRGGRLKPVPTGQRDTVDPEDTPALQKLRSICPERRGEDPIDEQVAIELLNHPSEYKRAVHLADLPTGQSGTGPAVSQAQP